MADDVAGDAGPEQVRVQPLQLRRDDADVLAALRDLYLIQALDRHGVGEGVGMRTDAAYALHQHQGLDGVALRGQLFYAAVVVADHDLRVLYDLALCIQLCVNGLL